MGKETVDQVLHFVAGAVVVLILGYFTPLPHAVAFLVMMFAAEVRELAQHDWDPRDQGWGSLFDLSWFAIGGGVALLVLGA